MSDYYYDDDNEAWDGHESHEDWIYREELHWIDCGMVDDKRLCADIGSEYCSFFCPFHQIAMARNPDDYPAPDGYESDET
jgi:hypothetical protein